MDKGTIYGVSGPVNSPPSNAGEVNVEKILLRIVDVQEATGLGRTKVMELISSGSIPSRKIGRCVRVRIEDLREWAAKQPPRKVSG